MKIGQPHSTRGLFDPQEMAGFRHGPRTMTSEDEAWISVVEWLSKLRTLQGVPFVYIVPTEEMLPNESIRFFHIDRNWLDALVDGAISVGTLDSRGSLPPVDEDNQEIKYQRLIQELNNSEINKNPYRNKLLGDAKQPESLDEYPSGGSTSGFLLRSTVVRDFPGLEVSAYEAPGISSDPPSWPTSDKRIQTIHQVRLSETILLCIFNGIPTHLRLQEPGEGIRLGLDPHKPPLDDPINLGNEITNRYTLKYKLRNGFLAGLWPETPHPTNPSHPPKPPNPSLIRYRVHTGDRSVIDIAGVLSKTLNMESSWDIDDDLDQDERLVAGGLVASQLMQFPYQQDFGYDSITQHPYGDSQTATVEESDILTNVQAEQEDDRFEHGGEG